MKIAVLIGGDSAERDVSLSSGKGIIEALRQRGHEAYPVDPALPVEEQCEPETAAIGECPPEEVPAILPERAFDWARSPLICEAEVVFNALHGGVGEDGTIQAILEAAGVPYTGTGVLGSALSMNKDRSKALFREAGVRTAPHILLSSARDAEAGRIGGDIENGLGFPVVVKPNGQGSSVGFSFVPEPTGIGEALERAATYGDEIVIERFIPGREITAAILGCGALPLVEIVPEGGFYDYKRKYTKGTSEYIVPAVLEREIAETVQEQAVAAFRALTCRDYARVDFRLSEKEEPFCLEVNTLPGMTELSLVPMAARSAGIEFDELVERICHMARARAV
ncbi:MAG: D-alanine--D-alanine ligase [bacterium]|nr:MAG: D-alanine--D-alanine ligase [bacterium]